MRTTLSQTAHDKMVGQLVSTLKTKGYWDIKADLPGHNKPDKITWENGEGYIPDITARGSDGFFIFEIETSDSLDLPHSWSQWRLFSAYAQKFGASFYLVVPSNAVVKAKIKLRELGIAVKDVIGL